MKLVSVNAPSASYTVKIGPGLLDHLGEEVRACTRAGRAVVVSGEHVFPLYGERAIKSLQKNGIKAESVVFPSGEETKSLARRGIAYVQIPTSLLAAVDSSVGGKTAVNLPAAKNQVGAFYQPAVVLCDTDTLSTLPERELRAGYAEVIKYAILGDADLFDALQREELSQEDIIETCVRMKADIVAEDEHDYGRRRLLNLGHTFGHAVEAKSGYQLLHGEAVAIGTAMIARAAVNMGMLDSASRDAITDILIKFGLPVRTDYTAD